MANKKKPSSEQTIAPVDTEQTTRADVAEEAHQEKQSMKQPKSKPIPKSVDPHEFIPVRNGTRGKLIYISPRSGEKYVWEDMGDTQEMELQELRNAKASNKKFFERNWFMFDEDYDWVIDYLGVRAFYRHALRVDHFDELFSKNPAEILRITSMLSNGQKRSIAYLARQAIADQKIDSMKVINALEEGLNTELIEH